MDITFLKDYRIYIKVSYVTILASIMTMIITQIIKQILIKKKIITPTIEESQKDEMLSRIGRSVALIMYTIMYLVNEMIINKTIKIDKSLITGLIGGATLTLTIAKGIYTMLHQWSQKKNIYERIKYNEEINQRLEETIEQLKKEKNTWILTNKKDK